MLRTGIVGMRGSMILRTTARRDNFYSPLHPYHTRSLPRHRRHVPSAPPPATFWLPRSDRDGRHLRFPPAITAVSGVAAEQSRSPSQCRLQPKQQSGFPRTTEYTPLRKKRGRWKSARGPWWGRTVEGHGVSNPKVRA